MLLRKTPLAKKRAKPRRNDGRVQHHRSKPKAGAPPTAAERRHIARVREMPCLVCGGPSTAHHVTSDGFKRTGKYHRLVVPLCAIHHQKVWDPKAADPVSVEGLGHAGFLRTYGIDLLAWAEAAWAESCALEKQ